MQNALHQRFISLVLLVAYAITGTSLLPACLSLAAVVDGSHTVQVRQSEQGTTLALLHHRANYTPRVNDHNNSVARLIVSVCAVSAEGSHELSSSRINAVSFTQTDAEAREVKNNPQLNLQDTLALVLSSKHHARETRVWREVQITPGLRLALSSVRLLI